MPTKLAQKQQQHVEMHRKVLLRKQVLRHSIAGPAYVPFIGDADLAALLYDDRFIYGADIDPNRVKLASSRVEGQVVCADCDAWPFPDVEDEFALADFDAYGDPYTSFRSFWRRADKADTITMFFTDGLPLRILRGNAFRMPDGSVHRLEEASDDRYNAERSRLFNHYLVKTVWPWFDNFIQPYHVIGKMHYRRGSLVYWGCTVKL